MVFEINQEFKLKLIPKLKNANHLAVKLPRSARQCPPSANLNHNPLKSTMNSPAERPKQTKAS